MSIRNTLGVTLLVLAAVASWYWSLPPTAPPDQTVSNGSPLGYYLNGARLLGTDDNGHITYVVAAERVEELPDQEQLDLHNVQVEYSPENEIPWLVSATRASTPKSGSYLDLEGEVELRSQPRNGGEPTVIRAGSLRFAPNDYTVQSDGAVELRIGTQRLEAVGVRAHLKDDNVELESKIHGQFDP